MTVAVPDWFPSTELVAITSRTAGVGAVAGAVYIPVVSIDPQTPAWPHAAPAIDQVTWEFSAPATLAANCSFPVIAIVALAGCTVTPMCARIVTLAEALMAPSAALVAVRMTGLGEGNAAGAM